MTTLIIDTALDPSYVAFFREGAFIHAQILPPRQTTAELIPIIEATLTKFQIPFSEVETIAVCTGPGSYTGTRTGVMTAKALVFQKKITLIPFHSLLPYMGHENPPLVDAKRGNSLALVDGEPKIIAYEALPDRPYVSPKPEDILKHMPNGIILRVEPDFEALFQGLSLESAKKSPNIQYL